MFTYSNLNEIVFVNDVYKIVACVIIF